MRVVFATGYAVDESPVDSLRAALRADSWIAVSSAAALAQAVQTAPDLVLYDPAGDLSLAEVQGLAPGVPLLALADGGSLVSVGRGETDSIDAVGRLAGGIAHDFNNLLTAINGYADLLLESLPSDSAPYRDVAAIRAAGHRAARLTCQLLAFSRRQVLAPRPTAINPLIEQCVGRLQRLLPDDISLVTELAASEPVALVDAAQLEQVLGHLAANALEAMPAGGRLRLATSQTRRESLDPPPGEYVVIEISDTGCGMSPQVSAQACEPFFTTKSVGQGPGLGLAMAYGTIKQSGGSLEFESRPGRGTTCRVLLPREVASTTTQVAPASGRSERVLVVEDEPTIRQLVRRTLEHHGFQVAEAEDGNVAWEWLGAQGEPVDLLLTDLVLPGRSGAALAAEARRRWPALPVLYMSGYTEHDTLSGQSLLPDCGLVRKPFRPGELAERVREAIDRR